MRTNYTPNTLIKSLLALLLLSFLFIQTGCRKTEDAASNNPGKFTDLKVDPSFKFDSYTNVAITINVAEAGTQMISLIKVYQDDPKQGGKLITSGATDGNSQFKTTARIPSYYTQLWIAKISALGLDEYVTVPISGTQLNYTFGQSGFKSTDGIESNDCNTGTAISVNGSYTINAGQIYVVKPGVSLSKIQLTINSGGTLRICGTANITSLNGTGKVIISPSGKLTLPSTDISGTIENYGTTNFAQAGEDEHFTINQNAIVHNYGNLTISNSLTVRGTLTNDYHLTVVEKVQIGGEEGGSSGQIINSCQMFVNSGSSEEAFKITNGTTATPALINNPNAYLKVAGRFSVTGQGHVSLGLQSLIETGTFYFEGYIAGPASQGSQIHALGTANHIAQSNFTGYIDFWASSISPKSGTFGPKISWHNPGYTIQAQDCSAQISPTITSSLTAAGIVGVAITPYVITASGTDPITYNATNLPTGLSFNASTHTISGTPTTAQSMNVVLTADNAVGTDTKNLSFTITSPGSAPIITSNLVSHTPVSQSYTYTVDASGTGALTYNASNLPSGLTFNATNHQITGSPLAAGVYNITLIVSNAYGTASKTLVLTVGTPPVITSPLTAVGITGQQFLTYSFTASGSGPITYNASNLPAGLFFSDENNTINGTPGQADVVNVTLTAHNEYGNSSKILVITVYDPVQAPQITSPLTAGIIKDQPFSYGLTATGTKPVSFNATNLPAGLKFDPNYNVITGIPTQSGSFNVNISASNSAGTDNKILVLSVLNKAATDTDGDGVADGLDAYPNDATRAFNSYYPNDIDFGSYSFEDLWPAYGDYDCNDLVINFNYKIVTNAQNKVVDLIAKFKVKSSGASFDNGFGVALSTPPSNVESVKGCVKVGDVVKMNAKGYEDGHTTNTVIIPFDAVNTLLGHSVINAIHGGYQVQTEVANVTVHFLTPQANIGQAPFNPFIFVNQDRGKEVHMKDNPPTELANPVYFGSLNDVSDASKGYYYRSNTGLPWGLEIPVDFEYPVEKADIILTYLHFAEWAQSSGTRYQDWYMNKPGYRNNTNIY